MAIAGDNVDREWIERPRRWSIESLRTFMAVFGSISSVFDFVTFGILLWVYQAGPQLFRTGWFVESLMTELLIILVIRTYRPFYRSRPGRMLAALTLMMATIAVMLPFLPGVTIFGFVPLPLPLLAVLLIVTALYVVTTELAKRHLFPAGQPVTHSSE